MTLLFVYRDWSLVYCSVRNVYSLHKKSSIIIKCLMNHKKSTWLALLVKWTWACTHTFAIQHSDLNHLMCVLTPVAFSRQRGPDADQIPLTFVHRGEFVSGRASITRVKHMEEWVRAEKEEKKRELTAPRPGRRMLITVKQCLIRRREALH